MLMSQTPKWLSFLERKFSWLEIPNLAIILVTLQAFGFLFVMIDPIWFGRLALVPELVQQGEYWRLITFLSLPLSTSPIWGIFSLLVLYFFVNLIENEWGAFKTTLYVLISVVLMIGFSFAFDYPITDIKGFETTLFFAAASLFPDMEVQLYFVLPVKIKWLAYLNLAFVLWQFISNDNLGRLYLFIMYLNYIIFFGPAMVYQAKQMYRKWDYRSKMRK